MTHKYYVILVNADNRSVPFEAVQKALQTDDWLRVNSNQFCAYSARSAQQIWESVMAVLDPNDLLVVLEVDPANGWVSRHDTILGWFNQPRT